MKRVKLLHVRFGNLENIPLNEFMRVIRLRTNIDTHNFKSGAVIPNCCATSAAVHIQKLETTHEVVLI